MLKKIICLTLALLMCGLVFVSCGKKADENLKKVELTEEVSDVVAMQVEDFGTIIIRLLPEYAPITVANFQKLVGEGFYDGLIFHRVIEGFMIQGGDPLGNGTGGSGTNIKGEFSANDVNNPLKHVRGTISMARQGENPYTGEKNHDSASSQFFICQEDYPYGDGQYAAFGEVLYGMEVVDAIAAVEVNSSDKPLKDVVITSIDFAKLK